MDRQTDVVAGYKLFAHSSIDGTDIVGEVGTSRFKTYRGELAAYCAVTLFRESVYKRLEVFEGVPVAGDEDEGGRAHWAVR